MNDIQEFGIPPREFAALPQETVIPVPEFTPPEREFEEVRDIGTDDRKEEFDTALKSSSVQEKRRDGKRFQRARAQLAGMLGSAAVATAVLLSVSDPASGIVREFRTQQEAVLLDDHTVCLNETDWFEIGAVWSTEPIDLSEDTRIEFDYFMNEALDHRSGYGSDGLAVAFSERPYSGTAGSGGELGYEGIAGVELDTFRNEEFAADYGGDDYGQDHVAIIGDAVWHHYAVTEVGEIDDGRWHKVTLTVEEGKLSVYLDNGYLMSRELPELQKPLYVGITGANGTGTAYKLISNLLIDRTPVVFSGTHMRDAETQLIADALEQLGAPIPAANSRARVVLPGEASADKTEPSVEEYFEKTGDLREIGSSTDADSAAGPNGPNGEESPAEETTGARTCRTCNGAGFICPGSVAADDPEGCHGKMYVSCKACNQTGLEADGSPCNWCKGTLMHMCPSFEEHYTCPDCGGTGLEP